MKEESNDRPVPSLAPLRALAEQATPGEWHVEVLDGYITGHITAAAHDYCGHRGVGARRDSVTAVESMTRADAYFIVAGVNYVRALLASQEV